MNRGWPSTERGWNPRTELQALRTRLGRLISSALIGGGAPDVELRRVDGGWAVLARLPGVAPEEVAVEVDNRELRIRARSEEEVNADQGMPGAGARTRTFEYRVALPAEADPAYIDAVMDHGLLTVTVPRAAAQQPQRRTIVVGRRLYDPGSPGWIAAGRRPGAPDDGDGRRGGDGGRPDGGGRPHPVDPAADRELHQPDVG